MKAKLTVTIDTNVIDQAKRFVKQQGIPLSHLVEQALQELVSEVPTFSSKWRGRFKQRNARTERYRRLARKYNLS